MEIIKEPNPEPNPLITTICRGSFSDNIRVQLFSNPQERHANKTKIDPIEKDILPLSDIDKITLEAVISIIANHILLPIASLKIKSAINVVATISKLLSKETLEDVVVESPIIKNIGAAISNKIIPMINGNSFIVIFASSCSFLEITLNKLIPTIPTPAPRYNSAAINVGGISTNKSFDTGELIPYNNAASMA